MVNINGFFYAIDLAPFDCRDRGLLLGDGFFETIRIYPDLEQTRLILPMHLDRMLNSAVLLGFELGLDYEIFEKRIIQTIKKNHLSGSDAVVRVTVTRGPGPRGLLPPENPQPTIIISAQAFIPMDLPGISVMIANTRRNEYSLSSRIKSISYLDNILARREAQARGCEEALMLNSRGNIAEGSYSNIFCVRDGAVYTPPISEGALPGIMRRLVIDFCRGSIPFFEEPISEEDLLSADEIFLTNVLMGVAPVIRVDEKDFPIGPITLKIR